LVQATYIIDPRTFVQDERSRDDHRQRLPPPGRIETSKYRGSELICEAQGPDLQTAMIHITARGIEAD